MGASSSLGAGGVTPGHRSRAFCVKGLHSEGEDVPLRFPMVELAAHDVLCAMANVLCSVQQDVLTGSRDVGNEQVLHRLALLCLQV